MPAIRHWKALASAIGAGLALPAGLLPSSTPGTGYGSVSLVQAAHAHEMRGESQLLLEVARSELVDEWLVSVASEIRTMLRGADIHYTGLLAENGTVEVRVAPVDLAKAKEALGGLLGPDGADAKPELSLEESESGLLKFTPTAESVERRVGAAVGKSLTILKGRVLALGIENPILEKQGPDRIVVKAGGLHDPDQLRELLARRARLTLQWIDGSMTAEQALNGRVPEGSSVLNAAGGEPLRYLVGNDVVLSGDNLVGAEAGLDRYTGQPVVTFRFDGEGTKLFARATRQNVGRALAVVLDGEVLAAPIIREPILGGSGQISGNFTDQSARDLALLLRAGALPATFSVIEARFKPLDP